MGRENYRRPEELLRTFIQIGKELWKLGIVFPVLR